MASKAKKYNLPSTKLDLNLVAGKVKTATQGATGKGVEYHIPVEQLAVLPGFNVRVRETADYEQHVEGLKQSIRENGFYENKPLAGYIHKDGENHVIYVTDGHTRLQAVQEINAEDVDGTQSIAALPVILKPESSSMEELTIALVQENNGRPLTPYETGIVVARLMGAKDADGQPKFTKADIARKLSITERYIDDLELLVDAPKAVTKAVLDGNVSSTLAIQELRRNPAKAAERISTAVDKAKAAGKSKATKKDIATVPMQKVRLSVSMATGETMGEVLKAVAKQIREQVPHSGKDDGDALQVDGTLSIILEIPAPPKPEKPAPAPKAPKAEKPAKAAAKPAKAAADKPKRAKKAKADAEPVAPEAAEGEKIADTPADFSGATETDATTGASTEVTSTDDDAVILPPAMPTTDNDDPDDI